MVRYGFIAIVMEFRRDFAFNPEFPHSHASMHETGRRRCKVKNKVFESVSSRDRQPTYARCIAQNRAWDIERSDRGIVDHNYDKLMVFTDITELTYEGKEFISQGDGVVSERQLRRGDLCLDVKTGRIFAAGPPGSIDPQIAYGEDTKLMDFWVALGDQHDEYWIEQPLGRNNQPIPWHELFTQRAMENLESTFLYCSQPPR